jgi:hypothetical protein
MTIDLKEHMKKKTQQKHIKAYDTIGKALDGMSIGTVLHILSAFTATVLSSMTPEERADAAMRFYTIIASDQNEDTPQ